MFTLRIHTLDTSQPPFATQFGGGAATSSTKSAVVAGGSNPKSKKNMFNPIELKGVVHLFRNLPTFSSSPTMTLFNVSTRTTLVFIVAVPNYLSPEEFIAFCGSHVEYFSDLCFIRDDSVEERYSVLIKLVNQAAADGFCCSYNGKRFSPSETEVCHIYFAQLVEYTDSAEIACIPQPGYTELPTCPVCLERLDHDTSAIKITVCDHSFQCSCITKWPFWSCQVCRLCQQDEKPTCVVCGTSSNPWVCQICSFVGCGRYERGHAIEHFRHTQHSYSLGLDTQQIWDYVGNKYVHRLNQSKIGSKSVATNHQCASLEGECGEKEDDEVGGALFSSKVDTVRRLCQQDEKPTCVVCGTSSNPWVCLICSFVGCGRYERAHAIEHFRHTQHSYSLGLDTQQIWDYVGNKYVHRLNQSKIGSKSVATNHQCASLEGECGEKEDDEVGGALFSSKVDTIVDEYNFLLATQMETQRQVRRLCQQDEKPTCVVCGTSSNPWVCLICSFVGCGRYERGHAIEHFRHTQHSYSLGLDTQQIWDYVGNKYVHRLNQSKVGSKSVATNHQCASLEGECGEKEDDEVGGALFSSKVDTIVDEYNFLLATQMETQRQVRRLCQQDEKPTCVVCGTSSNPWVCLICSFVGCGRYERGHAIEHFRHTQHSYSLGLDTQQIWDYVGNKYVHRLNQSKIGSKSVATNHQCASLEGECGEKEDDEVGGALFSSKVDTIVDEYNFLLATQMETQRQVRRLCQQDEKPTCVVCGTSSNPWVCLICSFVGCGRYERGHAIEHFRHTQHNSLGLDTQQIWDYVGNKYVHRLNQSKIGSKSVATNHQCASLEGECGEKEDDEVGGALFSSKVDTIVDEYNFLLATQMETQRQVRRLCQQDEKPTCVVCGTSSNPWVCLICGFVGCGRYERGHAIEHFRHTQHSYSLGLDTQQIWDYVGNKYVHRLNQSKIGSKSVATNHQCASLEGECGEKEDDEVGGALFSSKVDTIVDEYNFLLATQMETQRQVRRLCQQDEKPTCVVCGTSSNPWVCLICGFVGCGRYERGHAIEHFRHTQHSYSLGLDTQQIWDYVGNKYVHRLNQSKIGSKSVATNHQCASLEGECGEKEDDEVGGALFSSKVDTIVDEYNFLLATQMETQRQVRRLCQQDEKPTCVVCGTSSNPWVCLICGFVGCGRYERGHAIEHFRHTQHSYSLGLDTQQIWDYVGNKYVHRLNQSKIGSKSVATNHQCASLEGECGEKEDDEVGGALFSSKVDTIVDEYNFLLATQMETQRQLKHPKEAKGSKKGGKVELK